MEMSTLVPCAWAASTIVLSASSVSDLLAASVMSLCAVQGPLQIGGLTNARLRCVILVKSRVLATAFQSAFL